MPRTCAFDSCERADIKSKGWCGAHDAQMRRTGRTWPVRVPLADDPQRYLLARRDIDPLTGCWLWTQGTTSGYGLVGTKRPDRLVHRIAYELFVGVIPTGYTIHHKCAVRRCFNPEHLQLATDRENLGEMFARKALETRIAELEAQVAELRLALGLRHLREVV